MMKQMPEPRNYHQSLKQVIKSYLHRLVRNTCHGTDIAFFETHKPDCQFCVHDGLAVHSPCKCGSVNMRCKAEWYKLRVRFHVSYDSIQLPCTISLKTGIRESSQHRGRYHTEG